EGLPPLNEVRPTWNRYTPLRTERARRSALVEIDALVAVWLGIDIEALITIYQVAFPVLNRYEKITWFDANGWKLAGYHRTYGQIQQKASYDELLAYNEDPAKNPPPDGYTPPFYKADRVAEYRQAHAVFSEGCGRREGRVTCGEADAGGGRAEDEPHAGRPRRFRTAETVFSKPLPAMPGTRCGPPAEAGTRLPSEDASDCNAVRCSAQYHAWPFRGWDRLCGTRALSCESRRT